MYWLKGKEYCVCLIAPRCSPDCLSILNGYILINEINYCAFAFESRRKVGLDTIVTLVLAYWFNLYFNRL